MFAQMKSRRRVEEVKPCPCAGSCWCHKPPKGISISDMGAIFIFVLAMGVLFSLFIFIGTHSQPPVRHILVNGQDCTVQYVSDHCTATGACRGHDVAVCPGN